MANRKRCSKCARELGVTRAGKQSYCVLCHNEYMRSNRVKHKDLPELARKKANARAYVKVYVRRGKIAKLPCEICGEKAEIHHDDYDKPLQIRWLCRKHHLEHHKLMDAAK